MYPLGAKHGSNRRHESLAWNRRCVPVDAPESSPISQNGVGHLFRTTKLQLGHYVARSIYVELSYSSTIRFVQIDYCISIVYKSRLSSVGLTDSILFRCTNYFYRVVDEYSWLPLRELCRPSGPNPARISQPGPDGPGRGCTGPPALRLTAHFRPGGPT
jgi:hypothetical protein